MKIPSTEIIYERLLLEQESDPTVLVFKKSTVQAIKDIYQCRLSTAYLAADRVAFDYDILLLKNSDLNGNPAKRMKDELGITYKSNKRVWNAGMKALAFYQYLGKELDLQEWYRKYLTKAKK